MKKPTSSDVARLAGVSQSAVSRAFTQGASVSPVTRAKVLEAAESLGYRPNALARSLISGRSRLIGLVMTRFEALFLPIVLERLSAALTERGYHMLVFLDGEHGPCPDALLDELIDYQVDGIVVGSGQIPERSARRCARAGIPVVLFDHEQSDAGISCVLFDNRAGGRHAAEYLLASGCRRIAHLAPGRPSAAARERSAGFLAALAEAGTEPAAVMDVGPDPDGAAEATRALFGQGSRPDAIFCGQDAIAFRVLDTIRYDLKLGVPGDVAVIGFDDVAVASWPSYRLTTIRQDPGQLVDAIVAALMARIEAAAEPARTILPCTLVARSTTPARR